MTIRKMILLLLPLLAAVIHPVEGADECVFPGAAWEQAAPESQGVDSAKLKAAVDYLREAAGRDGVKRMVIVRNGRMIWRGPEADKPQGVWSVTKAFTSTAHGLLIEDGKCTLDTLAKDFDPALAEHYPTVTLRHFATMTSGLDGAGGGYDFDDQRRGDQNALVEPLPPFFPPGTKYMYWDEATQHYGYTLTQIAGESLHDYLKRRILDPIGMTQLNWKRDATGKVLNWTGGIEISAEDLARFGLLFLNRGNWNGRQLINAEWVDQATRVQVPPSIPNALPASSRKGSGIYGYHWWPNGVTPEGQRHWPDAPRSTYSRSGYNNNDLFVIPAWNMVTVRLGLDEQEDKITAAEYNTFLRMIGEAILEPVVDGELRVWHPVTVRFHGPAATETDDQPNPFLDYRLQVAFTGPSGQQYDVPGYFDGDGCDGGSGNVWCVRFTPDEEGRWSFQASFRAGKGIAVSLDPAGGAPAGCDGVRGRFDVAPRDPEAPGFLKWGRLKYVGGHYLKFVAGPYWIRGGTDSPENLLAYAGFDRTPPSHRYADHVADWRPGDPDWGEGKGRGIIGAVDYLASRGANSIYFLTHNIGGDGKDVWPWTGRPDPDGSPKNDNLHYDVGKLRQWETVFAHVQRQGVFLHFVFKLWPTYLSGGNIEFILGDLLETDSFKTPEREKLWTYVLHARQFLEALPFWEMEPADQLVTGAATISVTQNRGRKTYAMGAQVFTKPGEIYAIYLPKAQDGAALDLSGVEGRFQQRWYNPRTGEFEGPTANVTGAARISLGKPPREAGEDWAVLIERTSISQIVRLTADREHPWWQLEPHRDWLLIGGQPSPLPTATDLTPPHCAAIPDELYLIYIPRGNASRTLKLTNLHEKPYRSQWYNPRTAESIPIAETPTGAAEWPIPQRPSPEDEDWLVCLSRETDARVRVRQVDGPIDHNHCTTRQFQHMTFRHDAVWFIFYSDGKDFRYQTSDDEGHTWQRGEPPVATAPNGSTSFDILKVGDTVYLCCVVYPQGRYDVNAFYAKDPTRRSEYRHEGLVKRGRIEGRTIRWLEDVHPVFMPDYSNLVQDSAGHLWVFSRAEQGGMAHRSVRPHDISQWQPPTVCIPIAGRHAMDAAALEDGKLYAASVLTTDGTLYGNLFDGESWGEPPVLLANNLTTVAGDDRRLALEFGPAARRLHLIYVDAANTLRYRSCDSPYSPADFQPPLTEPGSRLAANVFTCALSVDSRTRPYGLVITYGLEKHCGRDLRERTGELYARRFSAGQWQGQPHLISSPGTIYNWYPNVNQDAREGLCVLYSRSLDEGRLGVPLAVMVTVCHP